MKTIIINYHAREKRFASIRDNRVESIVFDRPEDRSLVGNIYYGTVTKVLPGMNAVFINIGAEKNAYLHRDLLPSFLEAADRQRNISSYIHQGEKILVQVEKDATGTKGARVTGIIEIQGNHLIYMPRGRYLAVSKKIADETQKATLRRLGQRLIAEEEGIIFRTSSIFCEEEEIREELTTLRQQSQNLMKLAATYKKPSLLFQKDTFIDMILEEVARMKLGEVIVDDLALKKLVEEKNKQLKVIFYNDKENIFAANNLEHEIDKALKRIVWLDKGAYLIFDETEALTIIDVNTGKFSGKSDYQETVVKTNQLAAIEVVRQLRLRDIGGIVLIDFIDMIRAQDRQSILDIFEKEGMNDSRSTKMIGFTPLGILQMTRKKTKVSLSEALQVKCPTCDGTGRILSAETIGFRLERELLEYRHSEFEAVLVETTKEVKEVFLGANEGHRDALEELLQLKLFFTILPSIQHHYFLKKFGSVSEISLQVK
ncbi:MAG: Rne/Rng family ribonuclease [Bacillus sp. (in: Bacteria)]|nr:Rne/Rng family ribonuclease [Bacillus sp. (in: firmicutes)]